MAICSQLPYPRPQAPGGLSRCVRDYGGGCGQRTEVRASGAEAYRPLDGWGWAGRTGRTGEKSSWIRSFSWDPMALYIYIYIYIYIIYIYIIYIYIYILYIIYIYIIYIYIYIYIYIIYILYIYISILGPITSENHAIRLRLQIHSKTEIRLDPRDVFGWMILGMGQNILFAYDLGGKHPLLAQLW